MVITTMPTLGGITIISNGNRLGYPYLNVLSCLSDLCDEVYCGVDTLSDDGTLNSIKALKISNLNLVTFPWTGKREGEPGSSLSLYTNRVAREAKTDYLIYLQADEFTHEKDISVIHSWMDEPDSFYAGVEIPRLYFFESINTIRKDWTVPILRFVRRGSANCVGDAMYWKAKAGLAVKPAPSGMFIYHYSRVRELSSPEQIAKRVHNLDQFFHDPKILREPGSYDFKTRKFDSYAIGQSPEEVACELELFTGTHPKYVVSLHIVSQP